MGTPQGTELLVLGVLALPVLVVGLLVWFLVRSQKKSS
jgi:hypothetical protein